MKKVGIIFAMEEELKAFLSLIEVKKEYQIFDLNFYEGVLSSVHVVLVECGVGKVNAARTTQILIDNMKVDFIFNIGVAGGISKDLNVLDVVIGKSLVQHDFDITAFDHEKGYIPNIGVFIESDMYLVKLALDSICEDDCYKTFVGTIASGDIFCHDKWMSEKIHTKFNALCVEMEGASIAQVCYLSHIPFLVIRCISDTLNGDNVITYEEFLEKSSFQIAVFMKNILKNLSSNSF